MTQAARAAEANLRANLSALEATQPALAPATQPHMALEWVFARDSALTALQPPNHWWADCSVPRASAEGMFAKLAVPSPVAAMLAPAHAAQVQIALQCLKPQQAIVVIAPDPRWCAIALRSCDFSADIHAHRLWLACGLDWDRQLSDLLRARPGLCVPQQFIRPTTLTDAEAEPLIASAQKLFAEENARRSAELDALRQSWSPASPKIAVLAPSLFRLWNHEPLQLLYELSDVAPILRIDSDDPCSASSLGLAHAALECGAAASTNVGRDVLAALPQAMPLVIWITTPRIPRCDPYCPADRLLLADPRWRAAALDAGWPDSSIALASIPRCDLPPAAADARLAILADTVSVQSPPELEYSSHRLLWERVRDELGDDPTLLGADLSAYLDARMRQMEIAPEGFDRALFIDGLIVPAWQQGLARLLKKSGLPPRLFGQGWSDIDDLADLAAGPLNSAADFKSAAAGAAALVHAWPLPGVHGIDAIPRPIIRPLGLSRSALVRETRTALESARRAITEPPRGPAPTPPFPVLSGDLILRILRAGQLMPSGQSPD